MPVNQPTRAELDRALRAVHLSFEKALDDLLRLKNQVDKLSANDLKNTDGNLGVAYAYAQADVDNIKAMVVQYPGIVAAQVVVDFREFGSRLAGLVFTFQG